MKKKMYLVMLAVLSAGILGGGLAVQAKSYGVADQNGVTRVYQVDGLLPLTEDGKKANEEWEKFAKALLKEKVSLLKEYNVIYKDDDTVEYQDKKVRWLVDGTEEYQFEAKKVGDGTVDLYILRDKEGNITGVRESTEKEFQDFGSNYIETSVVEDIAEEAAEDMEGFEGNTEVYSEIMSQTFDSALGYQTINDKEAEKKKEEEYKKAGITKNEKGILLWEGKEIHILMDDDMSMMQNGSDAAVEAKIYLYVNRDEKGNITSVEQIDRKQVLEKEAARDR